MADDQLLPAFWSLSPSGPSPFPNPDPDPNLFTTTNRSDAAMDAADDLVLRLGPGHDGRQQQRDPSNAGCWAGDELLDLNTPLGWDCLGTDEDVRGFDEELDWAEILEGLLVERGEISFDQEPDPWNVELLLADDDEGFAYTNSDYEELTVAQFHDSGVKGNPPAARSAVDGLPSFVLSKEDVEGGSSSIGCAVCNEEMGEEEKGRRLPCTHCYHEGCILPWLEMRNTCPLCRHELPTDDPDYESCKAGRDADADVGALAVADDDNIMHDFDMLP